MNVSVHKSRATSRCSGQRHDVPESHLSQRRDVEIQRRDIEIQFHDIPEHVAI